MDHKHKQPPQRSTENNSDIPQTLPNVSTVTLVILVLSNIFFGAISSLPGPFFPALANQRGLNATLYGLIISTSHLSSLIFTPVVLLMVQKCPSKVCLCLGSFTVGGCAILFGTLQWCPKGPWFISLAFLIRVLEGFGAAAVKISTFVILASQGLPTSLLLSAYTSLESLFVSGLAIGPSVGAGLHHANGYYLPFYSFGGLSIISAVIALFALPEPKQTQTIKILQCSLYRNLPNVLYFFTFFTSFFYSGFLESTLAAHLNQINVSPVFIALLFALPCLVYNFMSPSWRWLIKKGFNSSMLIFIGGIFLTCSIALVGPVPFKRWNPLVTFSSVALALKGFSSSGKTVSSIYSAYDDAVRNGQSDSPLTFYFVCEMFTLATSTGLFLGSSTAGCLYDLIGFRYATLIPLGLEIIVVPLVLYYAFKRNYKRPVYMTPSAEENRPSVFTPSSLEGNYLEI